MCNCTATHSCLSTLEPRLSDEIAQLLTVQLGCSYSLAHAAARSAVEHLAPQYERLREQYRNAVEDIYEDDPRTQEPGGATLDW